MEQVCHSDPSGTALVWRWLVGEGAGAGEVALGFEVSAVPAVDEAACYALEVTVREARGLSARDVTGSSDPYVVLRCSGSCAGQRFRTATVPASLAPGWGERFAFYGVRAADVLTLAVLDEDTFGDDDALGEARLPVRDAVQRCATADHQSQWLRLAGEGAGDGELCVSMTVFACPPEPVVVAAAELAAAAAAAAAAAVAQSGQEEALSTPIGAGMRLQRSCRRTV